MTRKIALLAIAILLLLSGSAAALELSGPATDPASVRAVEWLRDHHLGWLVNRAEHVYYTHRAPRRAIPTTVAQAGGRAEMGAPATVAPAPDVTIRAELPVLPSSALAADPRHPADVAPHLAPPMPGEGVWRPAGRPVAGVASVYVTALRPDAEHPTVVSAAAWMDHTLLRPVLFAGTTEPGGTWPHQVPIPLAARPALVAAFNGGFRMRDARSGFFADGRAARPLRDGEASLVITSSGVDVGAWGKDVRMSADVVSVRQNLALIVDGGRLVTGLDDNAGGRWGFTLGNTVLVWRSGVGITAQGDLVFVAGNGLSVRTLATALAGVGAVRAMELDINSNWVDFYLYGAAPGNADVVTGVKLLPSMRHPASRYLAPESRDFVALFAVR